ncbi:MAG: YbjQ family protein [Planctomycetota bacterium]|nr:YbjQ family protein [Planctomycetota bacterium]
MLILTTDEVAAARITESLGLVRGTTVRTRHWGHHLIAAFKGVVGGEVHEYTKVIAEAREEALDRMKAEAFALGADAVVGFRFATSEVAKNCAEVVAYGSAVKVVRADQG